MSFYSDFADYYELVFPFRGDVYDFLQSHIRDKSERVLDVGCGTGHYCGKLAAEGFRSVGIDLDENMIKTARRLYPRAEFRVLDMLQIASLEPPFGAAFSIGNVTAHIPRHRLQDFLKEIRDLLSPQGLWIFQTVNWDYILEQKKYRFPPRKVGNTNARFLREYCDVTEERLTFKTRLDSDAGVIFEGQVTLYPVRAAQYLNVHEEAGFKPLGHFSSFDKAPFDPAADAASIFVFKR
jgi:SAM-dependent methyltransferase